MVLVAGLVLLQIALHRLQGTYRICHCRREGHGQQAASVTQLCAPSHMQACEENINRVLRRQRARPRRGGMQGRVTPTQPAALSAVGLGS